MAVYKQKYGWREDGRGQVEVLFRLADTYSELFDDDAVCEEANIFILDDIAKDVATRAGGLAEHEHKLQIDEAAVRTQSEIDALALVKSARSPSNIVYCAVFVDTTDTPQTADMAFNGVIQPEQEANDVKWYGQHFDQSPTPIRQWRLKARPFSNAIFDKFTLAELIDGTEDGPSEGVYYIDPIDSTWETNYVFDGQGWFSKTISGQATTTHVADLVAVNRVFRKLADQLEAGLLSKYGITLNINFERSLMEGKWHPTRWHHDIWDYYNADRTHHVHGKYPRWTNGYAIYATDSAEKAIDPDNAAYDAASEPTKYEQLYVSYRLLKEQDDEPDIGAVEPYMWENRCESFTELVYKFAIAVGCYAYIEQTDSENISIKFVRRQSFTSTQLFLKSSSAAQFKGDSKPLDGEAKEKWQGRAFNLALDGTDRYTTYFQIQKKYWGVTEFTELNSESSKRVKELKNGSFDDLIVTISPTEAELKRLEDMSDANALFKDNGYSDYKMRIPRNHYLADGGTRKPEDWAHAVGLTTALFCYVDKNTNHRDTETSPAHYYLNEEPSSYYTPVGAISINKSGFDRDIYFSLSEYLNKLLGFDSTMFNVEYTLDIPYYYGLSTNADGSAPDWRDLELGSQIVLDGVTYIVESIKMKLNEPKITLKMSGQAKYDFDTPSVSSVPSLNIPEEPGLAPPGCIIAEAYEAIAIGNCVAIRADGTVEVMAEESQHAGKYVGIAINGGSSGDDIWIQRGGTCILPNQTFTEGSFVYIHTNPTNPYNFSNTALTAKDGSKDMLCVIGVATDANEIALFNEPIEYIYP